MFKIFWWHVKYVKKYLHATPLQVVLCQAQGVIWPSQAHDAIPMVRRNPVQSRCQGEAMNQTVKPQSSKICPPNPHIGTPDPVHSHRATNCHYIKSSLLLAPKKCVTLTFKLNKSDNSNAYFKIKQSVITCSNKETFGFLASLLCKTGLGWTASGDR